MDRYNELIELSVRPPQAVLPENEDGYTQRYLEAKTRTTGAGQRQMEQQIDKIIAAGQPGLLRQAMPNYITDEARVRSFVDSFGQVVEEGGPGDLPEFTLLDPDDVLIVTVSPTGGKAGASHAVIYAVNESQSTGRWKEFQTEPVMIPFRDWFYPQKRALLEANAADKMAYKARKELDNIAWTLISGTAIKTTFTAGQIYGYEDSDVSGIPTGNSKTSSDGFFTTLRKNVIPYFQGIGMGDRVILVHVLHTDLQFIYQNAPTGSTLGGYSEFQRAIYDGGVRDFEMYGHRFRVIPENWKITTGQMYCNAGPVYKMWLPREGSLTRRIVREDNTEVRMTHRVYEILSPSYWWKNVLLSTWSVSAST